MLLSILATLALIFGAFAIIGLLSILWIAVNLIIESIS